MRLDKFVTKKYNLTRSKAQDLIALGAVSINGKIIKKAAHEVSDKDEIVVDNYLKYVSRAGLKLEQAIVNFNLEFQDKTVLDVGSSKGGFTECSLAFGAKHVYAYDVGKDQLDESLKNHPQVSSFEETNILDIDPLKTDICLIDVSFVSVKKIIYHLKDISKLYVILFKPQFEVGPEHIYGGIVKNEKVLVAAVETFKQYLKELEIKLIGYEKTTIKGKKGNQEYIFIGEKDAPGNKY